MESILAQVWNEGDVHGTTTKDPKPPNLDPLFRLYQAYFAVLRAMGIFPYAFNITELRIDIRKGKIWRLFNYFNFLYMCVYCVKPCVLLYLNHKSNYEHETVENGYIFQIIWVFGFFTITPIFFTFFFYTESIMNTTSIWLRLEKHVSGKLLKFSPKRNGNVPLLIPMSPLAHFSESEMAIGKRVKFLKQQLVCYAGAWWGCLLTMIPITYIIPRFPPFLNSIFLPDAKEMGEEPTTFYGGIIQLTLSTLELQTSVMAWGLIGGFDVLVSMICRSLCNIIDKLKLEYVVRVTEQREVTDLIEVYQICQIVSTQFGKVFSRLLFFQEITNLILSVFLLVGALNGENVLLSTFCLCNTFGVTLRMYVLYLPMAKLYWKSSRFVKFLKSQSRKKKTERIQVFAVEEAARIECVKAIAMKAWFMHKISPTSILDYTLALVSYYVTIKQVKHK